MVKNKKSLLSKREFQMKGGKLVLNRELLFDFALRQLEFIMNYALFTEKYIQIDANNLSNTSRQTETNKQTIKEKLNTFFMTNNCVCASHILNPSKLYIMPYVSNKLTFKDLLSFMHNDESFKNTSNKIRYSVSVWITKGIYNIHYSYICDTFYPFINIHITLYENNKEYYTVTLSKKNINNDDNDIIKIIQMHYKKTLTMDVEDDQLKDVLSLLDKCDRVINEIVDPKMQNSLFEKEKEKYWEELKEYSEYAGSPELKELILEVYKDNPAEISGGKKIRKSRKKLV